MKALDAGIFRDRLQETSNSSQKVQYSEIDFLVHVSMISQWPDFGSARTAQTRPCPHPDTGANTTITLPEQ
jgi:hypothetical protein